MMKNSDGTGYYFNPVNQCFSNCVSSQWCQGFRMTKMRNGGRVLKAVLNFYVRIKILVATFDTNYFVTESTLTINRCCNPQTSWFCSSQVN